MSTPPTQPKIYHITHVDNLSSIVADGGLLSDAVIISQGGPSASIGMKAIKQRRLGLPVHCHPGDCVGHYVPFYSCPRSIMLFVLYRGNHQDLNVPRRPRTHRAPRSGPLRSCRMGRAGGKSMGVQSVECRCRLRAVQKQNRRTQRDRLARSGRHRLQDDRREGRQTSGISRAWAFSVDPGPADRRTLCCSSCPSS